jgi:hypothetical protein
MEWLEAYGNVPLAHINYASTHIGLVNGIEVIL